MEKIHINCLILGLNTPNSRTIKFDIVDLKLIDIETYRKLIVIFHKIENHFSIQWNNQRKIYY